MSKVYKNLLLILVIISLFAAAGNCQRLPHFVYSEVHIIPSDSINKIYYSYRIPYDRFVFVKDGDKYTAGFRITIEVTDSAGQYITRQNEEKIISTNNFDETTANDKYVEGVLSFRTGEGFFNILPFITDENSIRDIRMHPLKFSTKLKEISKFLRPLICDSFKISCNNSQSFELTNFEGSIPFSEDNYFLIIPSSDTTLDEIKVKIFNKDDTVFSGIVKSYFDSDISLIECSNKILIETGSKTERFRNFVVKNFSQKLKEGEFQVYVSGKGNSKPKKYFVENVKWFNKPFSLYESKNAIELLKYTANKILVDSLLGYNSKKYNEVLFNYWRKYDPTKSTEFNPLMNEFYTRVDYAMKSFSPLSGKDGADTDRGKVYIIYGKPKEIERTSNKYGRMVERWIYENPVRIFEFVEKDGTGNYTLLKNNE